MTAVIWLILIAAVSGATVVISRRHRAYFQAMGRTRAAREALYDDVDRIVHQVLAERSDERVEGLRPIFVDCISLIAEEMTWHGLIPVPHAVLYLLSRSLEHGPAFLRRDRQAVWLVLRSLDPELRDMFIAATAARN